MISSRTVEEQLKAVGSNFKWWGRSEIRELSQIMAPGETIVQCVNGYYEGGFALMCLTDKRLLLVDRKPVFLTLGDIRFEMISELDYNHRLLNASIQIFTNNRHLNFTSWNHYRLRSLYNNLQQHVMSLRQTYMATQFQQQGPMQVQDVPPATQAGFVSQQPYPTTPGNITPVTPSISSYATTSAPTLTRRRRYPSFYNR